MAVRAALLLCALVAVSATKLKVDNKWSEPLCGSFNVQLKCPATCPLGCELDITDASYRRSVFQLREDGDVIGTTPQYSNPLQTPVEDVDSRADFPAFSEGHEDFSSAAFHLAHGSHNIEVIGSAMLSSSMEALETPEIAAKTACAFTRATCYVPEDEQTPAIPADTEVNTIANIAGLRADMSLISRRGLYKAPGECSQVSPVSFVGAIISTGGSAANAGACCTKCKGYVHGPTCGGFSYQKSTGKCFLYSTVTSMKGNTDFDSALVATKDSKTGLPIYSYRYFGAYSTPAKSTKFTGTPLVAGGVNCFAKPFGTGCAVDASGCRFGALGYTKGPKVGAWSYRKSTGQCILYAPGQAGEEVQNSDYVSGHVIRPKK